MKIEKMKKSSEETSELVLLGNEITRGMSIFEIEAKHRWQT